jgi:hypothetical protein
MNNKEKIFWGIFILAIIIFFAWVFSQKDEIKEKKEL